MACLACPPAVGSLVTPITMKIWQSGFIAPLDHRLLKNLGHLDPQFQKPAWDPHLQWGVPYMWNATGVVYNRAQADTPKGWAGLWNPALRGRMTMLDDPEDVIGACLQKFGAPFGSVDARQLTSAKAEAVRQASLAMMPPLVAAATVAGPAMEVPEESSRW